MDATKRASPEKTQRMRFKAMSDEAKTGDKLREETSDLAGMKKGGTVRATGKRKLHRGEMVRKKTRSSSRGSGRY